MAGEGLITLPAGIALIFGANVGTCVTAGLASIGKPREAVRAAVTKARASVAKQGLDFMGAQAVKKKSFLMRAKTYEEKRGINPVLAARDVAIRCACIRTEKAFRMDYREALKTWVDGEREVVFPAGTWWMMVFHRVDVVPAPT